MSDIERNKALPRRQQEAFWVGGDAAIADELFAPAVLLFAMVARSRTQFGFSVAPTAVAEGAPRNALAAIATDKAGGPSRFAIWSRERNIMP